MTEKNEFALVPRPSSDIEKAEPGAKRVLAGMVADALALASVRAISELAALTTSDIEGWFQKGVKYFLGKGVPQDFVEAVKWFRMAADKGHKFAQFNLAQSYDSGKGVQQDYVEKVRWYRKAAEQNFGLAQFNLGHCYASGEGVQKDEEEAVKWFRRAAGNNCTDAQMSLGFSYATGRGVELDYAEAYAWYNLAANEVFGFEAKTYERAVKACETLAKKMSPAQLVTAQKRIKELRVQIKANH